MNPDTSLPGEGSIRYAGWRIVLLCFLMAVLCWGFGFYGHGFYLAELKRLHGWPTGLIASASTVCYLFSAVLVVFISDAIRLFGARACVLTGGLCFAFSTAVIPFIGQPWHLFGVYLVMAVGWTTMSVGSITNILGLWFTDKRGLAISLALNGASLSGVVIVPTLVLLAGSVGFAPAMIASAATILFVFLPLAAWSLGAKVPAPRAAVDGRLLTSSGDTRPEAAWTRRAALRAPGFWSISAPFALAIFSQAGFLVHELPFLEPIVGRTQAGLAVAVTTSMAIVGRVALGLVAGRLNQRMASAASLASQAAALFVMTQTTDRDLLLAACALYGFSVGNMITFPALIIQREFNAVSFGMIVGLSTGISQFTYAFGPGLLGLVRDLTGGYASSLRICIALNLVAAAVVVRRPRSSAGTAPSRA